MLLNPVDNPILYKVYLVLIMVALVNYGFKAFNYNPLSKALSKTGMITIVYGLIGLAGVHFVLENMDSLKQEHYRQSGFKR